VLIPYGTCQHQIILDAFLRIGVLLSVFGSVGQNNLEKRMRLHLSTKWKCTRNEFKSEHNYTEFSNSLQIRIKAI
jgi:hypothetical protein